MQYLLGLARPEDQSSFEERLVTESEFYDEVLIAEDELIDQYLSGELSESERERFENHFMLLPERQSKMRFGRAFNKYLSASEPLPDEEPLTEEVSEATRDVPKPPPKPAYDRLPPPPIPTPRPWYATFLPSQNPILSYSLAAALVVVVGTVSWIALKNWRSPGSRDPGKVLAITLTPGPTRSEGNHINRISIPQDVGIVRLRLPLTRDDYPNYRATLLRDDRSEAWTGDHLPALNDGGVKFISADIPAQLLTPGDYQMRLSGLSPDGTPEAVGGYPFRTLSQ